MLRTGERMNERKEMLSKNICSYIGLAFMIFYYQLTDTVLYFPFINNCLVLALLFFSIQYFVESKYRVKTLCIFLFFIVVLAFQYRRSHDSRLLVYIIALLGLKNIPVKRIMKFILYEKLILMVIIIAVASLGIGFVPRTGEYTLGFTHGNLFMINTVEMFLLYICLNWRKMGIYSNIIVACLIFLTFLFSESRTGLVLFSLSFVLYLHIKYGKIRNLRYLNILTVIIPSILFLISISIPYMMSIGWFDRYPTLNEYINKFDLMLTSRLTLSAIRLKNTKFHMLFSSTNTAGMRLYRYTVVDSGYVQLILVFGILGSILFICYYTHLIRKLSQMDFLGKEKYIYLLSVLILSLNAFTENSLCSLKYNFTLLFVLLFSEKKSLQSIYNMLKKLKIRGNHV